MKALLGQASKPRTQWKH